MIELSGHKGLVVALAYSPDGRTLASASADGTARLWDLATGKLTATLQSPAARAYCVAFAPGGESLAVGYGGQTGGGVAQIWDVGHAKRTATWQAHARMTRGIAFHSHQTVLVTGGQSPDVRLWWASDSPVEMVKGVFPANRGMPTAALVFNSSGKRLAAISIRPAAISVWSFADLQHYRSSQYFSDWGYSVCFHPDDDRLAAGLEGAVALWDPADYRPPTIWPAHAGAVLGVAFTPDGRTLLTGGADGLVKLWDPAGRLRHTFDWKVGDVGAVAFAPDGLTAAAGGDGTILVWDVAG